MKNISQSLERSLMKVHSMLGCSEHNLMKNALVNSGQGMVKMVLENLIFLK